MIHIIFILINHSVRPHARWVASAPCSLRPMFPQPYVPSVLCSLSPMFPQPYVPSALCSLSPMFPQSYVPSVLCSLSPMFPQPYVLSAICSLSPMFPQPYVPSDLCSLRPIHLIQIRPFIIPSWNVSRCKNKWTNPLSPPKSPINEEFNSWWNKIFIETFWASWH